MDPPTRDQPVGAQDYLDRLVPTDAGMVLPAAPNPTDPHQPSATDRALDLPHTLRTIGDMFDLVLIDTPALLASSDALTLARQADGVLLVVSHRVALNDLHDVHDRLAFVKTPLIGYIYIRPHSLRTRTPWNRDRRHPASTAWIPKDDTSAQERP